MCGNIRWSYDRYGEEHTIWVNVISITSLLHENAMCNDLVLPANFEQLGKIGSNIHVFSGDDTRFYLKLTNVDIILG